MTTDQARDQFRAIVAETEALTKAGDADGANAEIAKLESLVRAQTDPREVLAPLTSASEPSAIRFNAAASLLGLGHSDLALGALDELAAEDTSPASVEAGALARYWRRHNT